MHCLRRIAFSLTRTTVNPIQGISSKFPQTNSIWRTSSFKQLSKKSGGGDDEWNDAWETAWLPEDLTAKTRAPWETDVNFPSTVESTATTTSDEVDSETKAFVEDMNEHWNERRGVTAKSKEKEKGESGDSLYSLETMKKDYRLKKQRVHAALWMKEIEKQEEAKSADSAGGGGDDLDRLLDSYSEIFDSANHNSDDSKVPGSEFKSKPEGWESMMKEKDGNVWEMSQREEDILLQEFDRRIAFCKFQIASFIKQHIFSRRRPIDGWKYMIEELGPNARKGKGSVSRLPALSDPSTQPFREENVPTDRNLTPLKGR